ncbi:MAG: hypothetical protein COA58_03760 [Bacteroidetes bacterium]|nr:MAG: hypothetical protein COA58_03760 [Bacteroidota bacterium]
MKDSFNLKHFSYLLLTFIFFTVVGTLTHEGGHIAVAKCYGYETTLHYGSMNYVTPYKEEWDSMQAIYQRHKVDEDNHILHEESERQQKLAAMVKDKYNSTASKLITIGGPIQTLLTSFIGILILAYRRKSMKIYGIKFWDWLAIFLALFSLRFVSNMTLSLINGLFLGGNSYFSGDEARLASSLNLPSGTFAVPLFFIGLIIALWVVFMVIPAKSRLTFILSGLAGGVMGYLIWLKWLGPIVMP